MRGTNAMHPTSHLVRLLAGMEGMFRRTSPGQLRRWRRAAAKCKARRKMAAESRRRNRRG